MGGESILARRVRLARSGARLLDEYLRIVYAANEHRWRLFPNGTVVSGTKGSRLVLTDPGDLADCTICRERFNERMFQAESSDVRERFNVEVRPDPPTTAAAAPSPHDSGHPRARRVGH